MVLSKVMAAFAQEIKGQFSQYDQNKSVLIVPLQGGRFQTVLGLVKKMEGYERNGVEFSSRVCSFTPELDLESLLRKNTTLCYARFAIEENVLKIQASALMDQITEALLKEIIMEVAITADKWEHHLTGFDVH